MSERQSETYGEISSRRLSASESLSNPMRNVLRLLAEGVDGLLLLELDRRHLERKAQVRLKKFGSEWKRRFRDSMTEDGKENVSAIAPSI